MTKRRRTITIDPDLDDYLAQHANASQIVNLALREHLQQRPTTINDILDAIDALRHDLHHLPARAPTAPDGTDEDPDLAAALNNLGL